LIDAGRLVAFGTALIIDTAVRLFPFERVCLWPLLGENG
jgi:hypothetical protein